MSRHHEHSSSLPKDYSPIIPKVSHTHLNRELLVTLLVMGEHLGRGDVLDRLVAELEILLQGNSVLDLEPDDGRGEEQSAAEETPLIYSG